MQQLDVALSYAKNGIKVFPCDITKAPLIRKGSGFKEATTDISTIRKWWEKHPEALVGSPNDQFTVIDVDVNGVCETGRLLTNLAIKELEQRRVIEPRTLRVRTMSGGTHYYYRHNPAIKRAIKCLPNIDLLGAGGYVILPDQKNYKTEEKSPWDAIKTIHKLDYESFLQIQMEFEEHTNAAKLLKPSNPRKISKKAKNSAQKPMETDIEAFMDELQKAEEEYKSSSESDAPVKIPGIINYDAVNGENEIVFGDSPDLYKQTRREFIKAHPERKILVDGKFEAGVGSFDTEMISLLFYNHEVQMKLCELCGLKAPRPNETTINHSVLPYHRDFKKSMGVRWSQDGSHLIIRDFSNFFSNKYQHYDYNIVRLFATKRYGTSVPRLSPAEFTVWFMKMLVDAGIVDCLPVKQTPAPNHEKLGKSEQIVFDSFVELDAIKRMYKGYCGETVFADKFSSAWTGISATTVGRVKKRLVAKNYIEYTGVYDCGKGKKDSIYKSPLYRLITDKEPKKMRIEGVINPEVKKLQQKTKAEKGQSKKEKEVQSKYPSLSTMYSLSISNESYSKLEAFCEDTGIPNMVAKENMLMTVIASDEYIEDVVRNPMVMIEAGELQLVEDTSLDGERLLLIHVTSPKYEEIWEQMHSKHKDHLDPEDNEPDSYFVLSFSVDDYDYDLDNLNIKLAEYTGGVVMFNEFRTDYLTSEQVDLVMDGKEYRDAF